MSLEAVIRPVLPSITRPYIRTGEPPTPPPEIPETSFLRWGKGGEFGELENADAKVTGGGSIETKEDDEKPKPEEYSFKEVDRLEIPAYFTGDNGVTVEYKRIRTITFEGPERIRGGMQKPKNDVTIDGVPVFSGGDGDEAGDEESNPKQLYKFIFTTPDPWTGIVQTREKTEEKTEEQE